jgi:hypothetical protein
VLIEAEVNAVYISIQVIRQRRVTRNLVGLGGFEPPTSPLSGVRSNQLSYRPNCWSFSLNPALHLSLARSFTGVNSLTRSFVRLVLRKKSCAIRASIKAYFNLTGSPIIGGAMRDRTADLLRARQALSQLSYSPRAYF